MTVSIRELFWLHKDLKIPEEDFQVVESRWKTIQKLQEQIKNLSLRKL